MTTGAVLTFLFSGFSLFFLSVVIGVEIERNSQPLPPTHPHRHPTSNLARAGGGSHWSLLVFDREGGEVGTAGAAGRGGEEESNGGGRGEKKDNGTDSGGGKKNGGGENVSKNKSKPVFRAYDSLGYKNMVCAKELSSALEEHLILEGDDIEGEAAAAEEKAAATEDLDAADGGAEERSRRLRQRRRLDAAASRTRSVAPTRVLNFVQGRCPRQGNASDCGIYILGKRTEKVQVFFFLRAVDPKRS